MNSNYNRFAYCVEPFSLLNPNSKYDNSLTATNLSTSQSKRISQIAYFGYGYGNHQEEKWYSVTQYLIWKEAYPNDDFYFTDSLNGKRISIYTNEINEINNLINNYLTLPSITNTQIDMVEGQQLTLTDTNNVLNNYTTNNPNITIYNNKLDLSNLKAGIYNINLTRNNNSSNIPLFYNSPDSQNMTLVGDIDSININLKVNVLKHL